MQIPTGVLVDALGPRRVVVAGGALAGAGSILFGAAGTLGVAAAGRALVGLGVSVTFISLLKLVAAWFREREFATLAGLVQLLGNLGAVASAAPLAWAVTLTSWRNVFVAIGLASLAGAAASWFVVRDTPGDARLPSMRELEGKPDHAARGGRWTGGLAVVARNSASWPGFFVNMGVGGTFLAFAGLWAVPYLTQVHGLSRATATLHTTVMLLAFALSSLAIGKASDRMGRRRPLMIGGAAGYAACWAPWVAGLRPPVAASLAAFAAMGVFASGFTLSWASAKEVNPPALSGTAMALVNTGVFLGPTVYQPLVGWALDVSGFRAGVGALAGFALLGLVATLFVRETRCRNVTAG
jgi:MFS family permease